MSPRGSVELGVSASREYYLYDMQTVFGKLVTSGIISGVVNHFRDSVTAPQIPGDGEHLLNRWSMPRALLPANPCGHDSIQSRRQLSLIHSG